MFIQVIQGRTNDASAVAAQNDRWQADLAPGAKGYLGMTGGVADDGTVIVLARFDSEASATANSERPEQGEWWNDMASLLDGEVTFHNCSDVDVEQMGDLDGARFVQVMQGTATNKARVRELGPQLASKMADLRPDVLGTVVAWDGDEFTQAVYFRSEADARKGETKMDQAPPELHEVMELAPPTSFIDLTDPWVKSR